MRSGRIPVQIGNNAPREVEFLDNPNSAGGIEVLTLNKLRDQAPPGEFASAQRPQFSILIFVTEGQLTHFVDFQQFDLPPGSLLLIHPGQLMLWGDLATAEGHCVLFRADSLSSEIFTALPTPYENNHWKLSPALARAFATQLELLESYLSSPFNARSALLHHQLSAILLHLSLSSEGANPPEPSSYRRYRQFQAILETNFDRHREVAWYARQLGISLRTLRNACQLSAATSPKQIIDRRVHLEAKRYLSHSELPIIELARILHFRDSSNFSTFFKQQEQVSPKEFRSLQKLAALRSRGSGSNRTCSTNSPPSVSTRRQPE